MSSYAGVEYQPTSCFAFLNQTSCYLAHLAWFQSAKSFLGPWLQSHTISPSNVRHDTVEKLAVSPIPIAVTDYMPYVQVLSNNTFCQTTSTIVT